MKFVRLSVTELFEKKWYILGFFFSRHTGHELGVKGTFCHISTKNNAMIAFESSLEAY